MGQGLRKGLREELRVELRCDDSAVGLKIFVQLQAFTHSATVLRIRAMTKAATGTTKAGVPRECSNTHSERVGLASVRPWKEPRKRLLVNLSIGV